MKLAKKITNLKTLVQLIKTFYKKKRKLKKQKDQSKYTEQLGRLHFTGEQCVDCRNETH